MVPSSSQTPADKEPNKVNKTYYTSSSLRDIDYKSSNLTAMNKDSIADELNHRNFTPEPHRTHPLVALSNFQSPIDDKKVAKKHFLTPVTSSSVTQNSGLGNVVFPN